MATQSLAVVQAPPAIATEIEQDLSARERLEAALVEIDKELATIESDTARQFAVQSVGKTPAESANLAVILVKAATVRKDQAQEKKDAVAYLLAAVEERLLQWRTSAPNELIAVLDRKIAEQTPIAGREQDEAERAQAILERLQRERDAVCAPTAASRASPKAGGGGGPGTAKSAAPAAAASAGGPAAAPAPAPGPADPAPAAAPTAAKPSGGKGSTA